MSATSQSAPAWLCWVESAKAAPARGRLPALDGEPVPCPACGADMRFLAVGVEVPDVPCGCGVTVSRYVVEDHCGGRFRGERLVPGLEEWLKMGRARIRREESPR